MVSTALADRTARSEADGASPDKRQRSAPHPRYSLEDAERLARVAFDMGARHVLQENVARELNYSGVKNGAFKGLRASAKYFGLIDYSGDDYIEVTDRWIKVFHDEDRAEQRGARQEALLEPEIYRQLIETFANRQLPDAERLARELYLTPKYGILRDAAEGAASTFVDSAAYAEMLDERGFLRPPGWKEEGQHASGPGSVISEVGPVGPEQGIGGSDIEEQRRNQEKPSSSAPVTNFGSVPEQELDGLDRLEIKLRGGKRAYLFVPVPLPSGEKERLKKYIDLILEEDE
jgi:hypothetical protein